MKLDSINEYKDLFAEYLMSYALDGRVYEERYKWDVIDQWGAYFSLDELENQGAFKKSLTNNYSGRLWGGEIHSAKSGMVSLMQQNPLLMNVAFADLFNENKDIDMRFNRFLFHCDQVLKEMHDKDDRHNNHYQDNHSISLYLSLQYPEQYGLYQHDKFHHFMEMVGSRNIPTEQEKERYFKSLRAIYTVISKDVEFMNGVNFLLKDSAYRGKSLFLVNDLIEFTVK